MREKVLERSWEARATGFTRNGKEEHCEVIAVLTKRRDAALREEEMPSHETRDI